MRIPKLFKPSFKFGVPGVPGVPDTTGTIENKELNPVFADTPIEWLGVPGVPDAARAEVSQLTGTPDTPDVATGVSVNLRNNILNNKRELKPDTPGTPDTPENSLCRKLLRTCGTCRHALCDPESDPVLGWRFCGLGWMGGLADHWHCDHWQDAACASPHDAQVERAKTLMALGWSASNAIAKACGESTQGGRP